MRKDFRILSNVKCEDCGRLLKQNLLDRAPHATKCYWCKTGKKKKIKQIASQAAPQNTTDRRGVTLHSAGSIKKEN